MAQLLKNTIKSSLKVGDVIHNYKLLRQDYIPELNITPFLLRHEITGSQHLHISNSDSNNVFAVSIRTPPKNSTGVAHILEHLALCGSQKYAVRDPFFKMLTRSLATFMNAYTSCDNTSYPFSTQNAQDYENLLKIYTDAVFFPRLRPADFRQEAWRLEHEKPDKKETPLVIRGVVYNEMKGLFSSSSEMYARHTLNSLFPDTTYRYESGGDPEHIPSLSHDELKKFHKQFYHPSNAKFFTYGDLPLEGHLKLINELVMAKFSENTQARELSLVESQGLWSSPRIADITCPPDPLTAMSDKQTTTSATYLLPTEITKPEEMLPLQIFASLMTYGPNAPFFKSLIESGLGSDYSPYTGLLNSTKQPYFSIGLQNIHEKDIDAVHSIIERTFKEVAETGFTSERIEAVLHNIELSLKHMSSNFGLRLAMSLTPVWNHDGDVIDSLRINKYVSKFKQSLQDRHYWRKLVDRYFISNSHKLTLNMRPDQDFEEKLRVRETNLLESKISDLKEVDLQRVLYEGMELLKMQETKDDTSVLPCLDVSKDITKELKHKSNLKFDTHKGSKIQLCEVPTNEVVYFRAIVDMEEKLKAANLIDYIPLFCDVATKLGAGSYNKNEFSQKMQLTTGGLDVSTLINPSLEEFDKFRNEILISAHCLKRNVGQMFDLWLSIFQQIHFSSDKNTLQQLVKAAASDLASGVPFRGHVYAMKKSASSLSDITALEERLSGLTFVARMKDISSRESIDSLISKLQAIAGIALNPFNMKCAINAESDSLSQSTEELKRFIESAQQIVADKGSQDINFEDGTYEKTKVEDMKFPFSTHFVAKSFIAVPRLHEDYARLVVMSKLISSKYFHREIREKGGAYGAGASVSNDGILNMYSYRDPNTEKTMRTFDHAVRWLSESSEFDEKDIEESKLAVFRDVDKPVAPGAMGLNYFSFGESDAMRQEYRRKLLEVSRDDVINVGKKYLTQTSIGTHII